jgi:hypothetical protein
MKKLRKEGTLYLVLVQLFCPWRQIYSLYVYFWHNILNVTGGGSGGWDEEGGRGGQGV